MLCLPEKGEGAERGRKGRRRRERGEGGREVGGENASIDLRKHR